ncbi:aldehyde reductase II [Fusarium beomiforme]|uniref:Aldehyde reductase II n=1 Tax=Fusarium beomiforme TaxID=44412 RepID=A0A9P5DRG6_9HYPO|nr:aldehyde reductase II [Fusarium beomiforme]
MTRVLLTGGSGYVASHILKILLDRGHSVVTTVRSQAKVDHIKSTYFDVPKSRLDFAIVEDMSVQNAYDEVMQSAPFEAVIHTASPFQLWGDDIKKTFMDPAILGTTGLLEAAKVHAPTVKRIVITSSLATAAGPAESTYLHSDKDWVEISEQKAYSNPWHGYVASKVYAEKAAWDFVKKENPPFTITTILPAFILGPIIHEVRSLDTIMTSGLLLRDFLLGNYKEEITPSPIGRFTDVRDAAMAHVRAVEVEGAGGKRFLVGSGRFSNREVATILWKNFPALRSKLPGPEVSSGGYPADGVAQFDVEPSKKVLGMEYETLENTVVSMTGSMIGLHNQ